ncbi:MAG: FkbM family methyltransferase [Chromatiales bacterium]|jgi:FkbM family methyltransferase
MKITNHFKRMLRDQGSLQQVVSSILRHPWKYLVINLFNRDFILRRRINGVELKLAIRSWFEFTIRSEFYQREQELIDHIDTFETDEVFYDIGANVGTFSLYAAIHHAGCQVYAFEPNSFAYARLVYNVWLNGCNNVHTLPVALYNESRYARLNIPHREEGTAGSQFDDFRFKQKQLNEEIYQGTLGYTADRLVHDFSLPLPTRIKIDVDGHELKVLQGMPEILDSPALQSVFIEINSRNENGKNVIELLARHGFVLKQAYGKNLGDCNHLFERGAGTVTT